MGPKSTSSSSASTASASPETPEEIVFFGSPEEGVSGKDKLVVLLVAIKAKDENR